MTVFFDEKIETMSRDGLSKMQGERLRAMVKRAYERVPFYKEKLDTHGVLPDDIKTISDITKLPFTVKEDFRRNYPFGMFAVPLDDVVRVHASSGTTGKPTVVGYTQNDINLWASHVRAHLPVVEEREKMWCKLHMDMVCLRVDWECIMVENDSVQLSFPSQVVIRNDRSC